jgi:hypothetical protein
MILLLRYEDLIWTKWEVHILSFLIICSISYFRAAGVQGMVSSVLSIQSTLGQTICCTGVGDSQLKSLSVTLEMLSYTAHYRNVIDYLLEMFLFTRNNFKIYNY